jgi:septal ring factor EnvC (AmiA/AmiB activator)
LENKEQSVLQITKENDQLSSSLNTAEGRLAELYADQGRAEDELAARIEVIEKLRSQARELEKEKRDIQRRYNEQVHRAAHIPVGSPLTCSSDFYIRGGTPVILR